MSRFFSEKYRALTPYVPGEQPLDMQYVKLNTNESPFPPSKKAIEAACREAEKLQLYPDPDCGALREKLGEIYGLRKDQIILGNGSDEILNFAFMAFCDDADPALFPDISYGFYPVFARQVGVPFEEIPLRDDFTLDIAPYLEKKGTVFIANPNAPTGLSLSPDAIEKILKSDPGRVVVIDEAYVDFGGESCIPLIERYDNLLVVQTFSKSRSMAGARLGFGAGNRELIGDLNTLRNSVNPYNINRMTMAAGLGMLEDEAYRIENCRIIEENRAYACEKLREMGFVFPESKANFIFASHEKAGGKFLYEELKKRGVLVRHFDKPRIGNYNRITVGTREQMDILFNTMQSILEGSV